MPGFDDRFAPLAPIATVSLTQPDSDESVEDISMLIDSGADVTLVPRSAITTLGVAATGEH